MYGQFNIFQLTEEDIRHVFLSRALSDAPQIFIVVFFSLIFLNCINCQHYSRENIIREHGVCWTLKSGGGGAESGKESDFIIK